MECSILLGGQPIGKATVEREGLYYRFDCRCQLSGDVVCRLTAQSGEKSENLGIPVPEHGVYTLRTRIPAKRLGEGEIRIRAVPKHDTLEGKFIPLSPEEPFRYLQRLQNAFLQTRDGKVGVVIQESHPV